MVGSHPGRAARGEEERSIQEARSARKIGAGRRVEGATVVPSCRREEGGGGVPSWALLVAGKAARRLASSGDGGGRQWERRPGMEEAYQGRR